MFLSLLVCNFDNVTTFLPYSHTEINSFLKRLIDMKRSQFQLSTRHKFIFDDIELNSTSVIFLFESVIEHHNDIVNELLKNYPGILIDGYNVNIFDERKTLIVWSKKTLYSLLTYKSLNIFEAEQYLSNNPETIQNNDFFFPPELIPNARKFITEKLFKIRDIRRTKLPSLKKRQLESIVENDETDE